MSRDKDEVSKTNRHLFVQCIELDQLTKNLFGIESELNRTGGMQASTAGLVKTFHVYRNIILRRWGLNVLDFGESGDRIDSFITLSYCLALTGQTSWVWADSSLLSCISYPTV